jgi:hypothetical protein
MNVFSIIRHADPWQEVRREVQSVDEFWNEVTSNSMFVLVPQLKQIGAILLVSIF